MGLCWLRCGDTLMVDYAQWSSGRELCWLGCGVTLMVDYAQWSSGRELCWLGCVVSHWWWIMHSGPVVGSFAGSGVW